jgi:hypothetical protein
VEILNKLHVQLYIYIYIYIDILAYNSKHGTHNYKLNASYIRNKILGPVQSILQSKLPLKKTNVNECTERSSSTNSTDYAVVMQANVPHLYTDSKQRYSIQTFIKNITMVMAAYTYYGQML